MPHSCIHLTQDGDSCKREAQENSKFCWQHAPKKRRRKRYTRRVNGVVVDQYEKTTYV